MRIYSTTSIDKDSIPVGTLVEVVVHNGIAPPFLGQMGIVKGYFTSPHEIAGGWHVVQFEVGVEAELKDLPYVNRIYLEVVNDK